MAAAAPGRGDSTSTEWLLVTVGLNSEGWVVGRGRILTADRAEGRAEPTRPADALSSPPELRRLRMEGDLRRLRPPVAGFHSGTPMTCSLIHMCTSSLPDSSMLWSTTGSHSCRPSEGMSFRAKERVPRGLQEQGSGG